MKITSRLLIGFSFIIVLFLGILYVSSQTKSKIKTNTTIINSQIDTSDNDFDTIMAINMLKIKVNQMVESVLSLGYVTDIEKQFQLYEKFNQQLESVKKQADGLLLTNEVHTIVEKIKINVDDIFMYKQAELNQIQILNAEKEQVKSNKEEITAVEVEVKKFLKLREWKLEELGQELEKIDTSQASEKLRNEIKRVLTSFSLTLYELEVLWNDALDGKENKKSAFSEIPLVAREILRNTQESHSLNKQIQKQMVVLGEEMEADQDFQDEYQKELFLESFQLYGKSLEDVSKLLKKSREIMVDNIFLNDDIEYKEEGVQLTKNLSLDIINNDLIEHVNEINAFLNTLHSAQEKNLKNSLNRIRTANHEGEKMLFDDNQTILFLVLFSIFASVGIAVGVSISIRNPLKQLLTKTKTLQELDFTVEFETKPSASDKTVKSQTNDKKQKGNRENKGMNEFAVINDEMHTITSSVKTTMYDVKEAFANVGSTSENIRNVSDHSVKLSNDLHQQIKATGDNIRITSNAIEEINSFMEEISASSKAAVVVISEINEMATDTSQTAQSGKKEMEEIGRLLDETHKDVNNHEKVVDDAVVELESQRKSISGILETIEGISKQTNLLALNAAVEAARAGDAGKGFAVVAEEIRKLAEETHRATSDINKLLKQFRKGIASIDNTSKETVGRVFNMTETSKMALFNFKHIVESVDKISDSINELQLSSEEKNQAIEEITTAVSRSAQSMNEASDEIDSIELLVQEQVEAIKDTKDSAYNMHHLAEKLSVELNKFKV